MVASAGRVLAFAAAVCVVCASVVSASAVLLQDRQRANEELDRRRNVLVAAGLVAHDEALSAEELQARFARVRPVVVPLPAGEATVYEVRGAAGARQRVVLPVEGPGLWSTLHGFLCLEADASTICGITFYRHAETPGLGAQIEEPAWQARWVGRQAFDPSGTPRIAVAKGPVGPPDEDPYRVDGITGATITCRGVTELVQRWLGDDGFGPYLRAPVRFVADEEVR